MTVLEAIVYSRGALKLLDQRLLPGQEVYIDIESCDAGHAAIKDMAVRGAPAIAVAGILSLAVELHNTGAEKRFATNAEAADNIKQKLKFLVTSRPTAVNLLDASRKLHTQLDAAVAKDNMTPSQIVAGVIKYAEGMLQDDIDTNRAIGAIGSEAMLQAAAEAGLGVNGRLRVLTHCNTGSLATVQYGTALGCIRALMESGKLEHAYCTETRPYNQGARLTAYELKVENIPSTLIADSAAAALMSKGGIDAVVVGADRVAANGDTANKVGTCMLSVAAKAYGIPFFIAAPTTSIDPYLASGADIEIEERSATELTHSSSHKSVRVVVEGMNVWNPAFDVASAPYITGIITEKGMVPRVGSGDKASFQVRSFFKSHGLDVPDDSNGAASLPLGFQRLDVESVKGYVAADPELRATVGGDSSPEQWSSRELSDGNINFVYLVQGPDGGVIVKQGLPYVRVVGEGWPLTQERLKYEAEWLREMHEHCPAHVPCVHKFDEAACVIVMQFLAPPHVILRHGLLQGAIYPALPEQLAEQLACCLFRTSMLCLPSKRFAQLCEKFQNTEMRALTEQVIFTDPYYKAPYNRHTSPHLDEVAEALYTDTEAKLAAIEAKTKFCQNQQALLHGDLHTGSCMVTHDTFYVIDSEFAFMGPMAFDIGKILANFLLTFFALDGHSTDAEPRLEQRAYVLKVVRDVWNLFSARFIELWHKEGAESALYAKPVLEGDDLSFTAAQTQFMRTLFDDALLFGGCVMIRRLVGIAHNADFENIEDVDARAICEGRALAFGRHLLVSHSHFSSIESVTDEATKFQHDDEAPCYGMSLSGESLSGE